MFGVYESVCGRCTHCKHTPETRWEPEEDWCTEQSDNYGTEDGCYRFEER